MDNELALLETTVGASHGDAKQDSTIDFRKSGQCGRKPSAFTTPRILQTHRYYVTDTDYCWQMHVQCISRATETAKALALKLLDAFGVFQQVLSMSCILGKTLIRW